jgi:hypothetical protein
MEHGRGPPRERLGGNKPECLVTTRWYDHCEGISVKHFEALGREPSREMDVRKAPRRPLKTPAQAAVAGDHQPLRAVAKSIDQSTDSLYRLEPTGIEKERLVGLASGRFRRGLGNEVIDHLGAHKRGEPLVQPRARTAREDQRVEVADRALEQRAPPPGLGRAQMTYLARPATRLLADASASLPEHVAGAQEPLLVRRVESQPLTHPKQRGRAEQRRVVEVQDIEASPEHLFELPPHTQRAATEILA